MLTKADCLKKLAQRIQSARILPMTIFSWREWLEDPEGVLSIILQQEWANQKLIVRSSTVNEDQSNQSLAGHYLSISDVSGKAELLHAITQVLFSYGEFNPHHQILIQPYLEHVEMSGVAFSHDPNSRAPYYVINYDDHGRRTDAIASGEGHHCSIIHHHRSPHPIKPPFEHLIKVMEELKRYLNYTKMDVEFAMDSTNTWYLLQVRPLVGEMNHSPIALQHHTHHLQAIETNIQAVLCNSSDNNHSPQVLSNMADWNPAEMIGTRPRRLAMSLYQHLITNDIWSQKRAEYGYCDLQGTPLMLDLNGVGYINTSASFASLIPRDINQKTIDRLLAYYKSTLHSHPEWHDKIESRIVMSCHTLHLKRQLINLPNEQFSQDEKKQIFSAVTRLSNRILSPQTSPFWDDLRKIQVLKTRQDTGYYNNKQVCDQFHALLSDCRLLGTSAFAGIARCAFIGVAMLDSMLSTGIITETDRAELMSSLNTVGKQINIDYINLDRDRFLRTYGHLRPGTYDITSPRYDETPNHYFSWAEHEKHEPLPTKQWQPSNIKEQALHNLLRQDGIHINSNQLFSFITRAIIAREEAKFIFTRNLSDALCCLSKIAKQHDLDNEMISHLDLRSVQELIENPHQSKQKLLEISDANKQQYNLNQRTCLPATISRHEEAWSFEQPRCTPNFITQKNVTGPISTHHSPHERLTGSIVCLPSADPGYDWIFTHHIIGLITEYGGCNSHMAIRANELGIAAVIGAGELKYRSWSQAKVLHINCLTKQVHLLCA
jgi:phosphohistidine swiveling domain-containing protein